MDNVTINFCGGQADRLGVGTLIGAHGKTGGQCSNQSSAGRQGSHGAAQAQPPHPAQGSKQQNHAADGNQCQHNQPVFAVHHGIALDVQIQRDSGDDCSRNTAARTPRVVLQMVQHLDGGQHQQEHQHVIPAAVRLAGEHDEQTVADRAGCYKEQPHQQHMQPVPLPAQQISQNQADAYQGQVRRDGIPVIMHHSGKIEHILRREEERPQHLQVIGPVKGQLAQADVIRYAGIIEHRRNGGDEQYPRHADAQTAFQDAGRNFAGIFAQIRPGACVLAAKKIPRNIVKHQEENFPDKEVIVDQRVDGNDKQERSFFALLHAFVQPQHQKREQGNHIMEVIEHHVDAGKTGKCIQHTAKQGAFLAGTAAEVGKRCQPGNSIFEHIDPADQIGKRAGGEEKAQPEKRAAKGVKAERGYKVRTNINAPVPQHLAAFDGVVAQHVVGELFCVKIRRNQQQAAVPYHVGQQCSRGNGKVQHKSQQQPPARETVLQCLFHVAASRHQP